MVNYKEGPPAGEPLHGALLLTLWTFEGWLKGGPDSGTLAVNGT